MSVDGSADTSHDRSITLCGVIPPMISPLDQQGQPDVAGIAGLVEHILRGGCSGLFVLGGFGEGAWLTTSQRGAVIKFAVAAVAGRVPVLAGVMLPGTGAACEAARQAEAEGADALVAGSPYYFGVAGVDQERHIETILDSCSLPLMLYNIPQCTHNIILPETVASLARNPRVIGIKDSAEDAEAFQKFLAIKTEQPNFKVLQGGGRMVTETPPPVGDGLVPGLANIAPRIFVALFEAAKAGNMEQVARLQAEALDLARIEKFGHFLTGAKVAIAALGFGSGTPALPLALPDTATQRAIAEIALRHQEVHA
jgi:dihydrodipicolinate synthase/N-acetylneuraminate lyase